MGDRAGAVSQVATAVGTVACKRAGGSELSRKGPWFSEAANCAWVSKLLQLAPVTDYLSASGNLNQGCGGGSGSPRGASQGQGV